MKGKCSAKKTGEKKSGYYAYQIGNTTSEAIGTECKKSIWTAWAERLNKEDNWFWLILVGVGIFVVASIIGLFLNHWVGLKIRIIMSGIYIILMVASVFMWTSETEKRGRFSWNSEDTTNEVRFFWLASTKSIASFIFYLGISLFVPCLILSNWSGNEYTDNKGRTHAYNAYYYQSGNELTKRYPTFWAWPWVKIAVLPPITDGPLTVNIGQRQVEIEYTAEYRTDEPREILEVFCANNSPKSNKGMIDSSICVLVRSEMERANLPKEAISIQKPLNVAFLTTDLNNKVDKLRDSIAAVIMTERQIPCVKITSLKFPT